MRAIQGSAGRKRRASTTSGPAEPRAAVLDVSALSVACSSDCGDVLGCVHEQPVPLVRAAPAVPVVAAPALDAAQQAVVDHPGGPLLVLAGPGTGKTTTLVEAIVERIDARGADPSSVLALTFSRKAAEQLRDRVTARLGRTVASPLALDLPLLRLRPGAQLHAGRALRRRRCDCSPRPSRPTWCMRDLLENHRGVGGLARGLGGRGHARVRPRGRRRPLPGPGEGCRRRQLIALGRAERPARAAGCRAVHEHYLDNLDDHAPSTTPT